jgi:prepilin-type N-terminal cleavage/methylation domain-containing protein
MLKTNYKERVGGMRIFKRKQNQKGFTLLEVLLVVAIIAILAGIVIIAINPGKQLADSRDAQRQADVTTTLNAIYQYTIDNNGVMPTTLPATATEICKTGTAPATCTSSSFIDLSVVTASGKYVASFPTDPQNASGSNGTGYKVLKDATTGRITVSAPKAENKTISVTR